jgi:L-serine dehydratase
MGASQSIFNDVLGPIMRGPSSSHTAGAYRIARVTRALLGEPPSSIRVRFDPDGSYAPTYEALGVETAFCAGLLGWEMTDPRYGSAPKAAHEAGIDVGFEVTPIEGADHPNAAHIVARDRKGRSLALRAKATGGGAIEVTMVDDLSLSIDGKAWDLVAWIPVESLEATRAACLEVSAVGRERACAADDGRAMLHWQSPRGIDLGRLEQRAAALGEARFAVSPPLFFPPVGAPLVSSAAKARRLSAERGCSLGALAVAHEMSVLDQSKEETLAEMARRVEIMKRSIDAGLEEARVAMPLTEPSAADVLAADQAGRLPLGGPRTRAAARALAVMHTCNSGGVVCAAPTGGSAGVLPGALSVIEEEIAGDRKTLLLALFAASAVGLIVAVRATFAAETAGCQVEIGVAGAMAAAAVVEAAGGTAAQALDAASIALQNTMGSVCDPVCGGCEIPCHTRNAAAASAAFTIADLVIGGHANAIPLDEAIDASLAVGMALPHELRCTARGGIAVTPSARRLCEESRTHKPSTRGGDSARGTANR